MKKGQKEEEEEEENNKRLSSSLPSPGLRRNCETAGN